MKDKVSFLQSARFVKVVFSSLEALTSALDNPLQIAHTSDHTAGEPSTTYLG
jgi:hypothetical protein